MSAPTSRAHDRLEVFRILSVNFTEAPRRGLDTSGTGVTDISASVHGPVCTAAIEVAGVGLGDCDCSPSTIGVSAAGVGDVSGLGDAVTAAAAVLGVAGFGAGLPEQA
jgi:hypothetical protein